MPRSTIRLTLLALALVVSTPLAAQRTPQPIPRTTLLPFVGHQLGIGQAGTVQVDMDGEPLMGEFETRGGGGVVAGLQLGIPVERLLALPSPGGVQVVAALSYGTSGAGFARLALRPDSASPDLIEADVPQAASSLLMAKLGLGMRSATAIPVELTVAPALVRVTPRDPADVALGRDRPATYVALDLGGEVQIPTRARGLVLHLGVEDFVTFAGGELAGRIDRYLLAESGATTRARLSRGWAHLLTLRVGLSYPLRDAGSPRSATGRAGDRGAAGGAGPG